MTALSSPGHSNQITDGLGTPARPVKDNAKAFAGALSSAGIAQKVGLSTEKQMATLWKPA